MRLALAQMNSVVGDLDGNRAPHPRAARAVEGGRRRPGALPRARRHRLPARGPAAAARRSCGRPAARSSRSRSRAPAIAVLVGAPHLDADLFNACYVLAGGEIRAVYRKRFLPNYGVFDENRYFAPGSDLLLLRFGDVVVGPTICEDIWQPGPPATDLALAGAQLVVNISASPFHVGKDREREEMLRVRARDNSCFVALCNMVGGQDELIFDGQLARARRRGRAHRAGARASRRSCSWSTSTRPQLGRPPPARRAAARARARARHRAPPAELVLEPPRPAGRAAAAPRRPSRSTTSSRCGSLSSSGLRDYVRKNGFGDVVIGLSGGIDSALTAAIAVGALGAERVHGVSMPSRFSSEGHPRRRAPAGRVARDRLPRDRRSSRWSRRSAPRSRRPSRGASPISPRRTCRRGCAGRC